MIGSLYPNYFCRKFIKVSDKRECLTPWNPLDPPLIFTMEKYFFPTSTNRVSIQTILSIIHN